MPPFYEGKVSPRKGCGGSASVAQQHAAGAAETLVFGRQVRLSPLYSLAVLPLHCLLAPPSILDLTCLACPNWWGLLQAEFTDPSGGLRDHK